MNKTKKDNVFWGVLFLLAAVYIIINNFGFAPDINVMKVIVAVLCAVVFFKSLFRVEFGGMLFSLAILAILFDDELGITAITPWPVLVAALLGSIGLNMIFGNHTGTKRRRGDKNSGTHYTVHGDSVSGDEIVINGMFNGYKKNISSDHFKKADVSCKFCGIEISFDDVMIQDGSAVVNLELYFSGVELYIPYSWKIVNNTDCMFGGFDEHRASNGEEGPEIIFEGNVRFSGVDVYRI
ncbi:MAG: hypothetical protein NC293_04105 [Roseburia sp.]|nr:hypothetical protein [Roseburia sp.]